MIFLVGYATTIGLGCVLVAGSPRNRFETLATVGPLLAWGQIAAALLDGEDRDRYLDDLRQNVPSVADDVMDSGRRLDVLP